MEYGVQKGDTLLKLANRFGVSRESILAQNPFLRKTDYLVPGLMLSLPHAIERKYEVQKGDTLPFISEKFGISGREIIQANSQLANTSQLTVGEQLIIPFSASKSIVQTNQEYSYKDVRDHLESLKRVYPFILIDVIGTSVLGKNLYAIRLGCGKKKVFYSGAWHANEWLTTPVLMKFIEDYAAAYSKGIPLRGYNITTLYSEASIWIVPMVNPDGVELVQEGIMPECPYYEEVLSINNGSRAFKQWTANIRGVDLNHQWPALWEEETSTSPQKPSPCHYGGEKPISEPETQAIYSFTHSHSFASVLAFHSQGKEIFWGFNGFEPYESEEIAKRLEILSTYRPIQNAGSGAGYKDWFIQEFRRPGFTIEIGTGVNPLPVEQFDMIYNQNLSMMLELPFLVDDYY